MSSETFSLLTPFFSHTYSQESKLTMVVIGIDTTYKAHGLPAMTEDTPTKSNTINITLKGLASMHKPSSTSILYAPPLPPSLRLHSFAFALRNIFSTAGFLVHDTRPLLLHATIVNLVYVRDKKEKGGHGKNKAKMTVDATALLEDWAEHVWMQDVRLEKVTICRMGAKDVGRGEEYVVEGEVDMHV